MTYQRQIVSKIARLGQKAKVREKIETGSNKFNNPEHKYKSVREVFAFRTYPNRNTEVEKRQGERRRDKPVFLVATGENLPEPPEEGSRLVFNDNEYDVKAHTVYDTHVEFFGEQIID